MGGYLYRHARNKCKDFWVRQTGIMSLEKWSGCRHFWANRILTNKIPKAQDIPQAYWKLLVKRHGQIIAAERLLIE